MNAPSRDWRLLIGNGVCAVGQNDGLFWMSAQKDATGKLLAARAGAIDGVVPLDEIRGKLIGRLKEQYGLAARLGWPVDPAPLEPIVGCSEEWIRRDRVLFYAPEAARSAVVPASTDELLVAARSRISSLWVCRTQRTLDEVLDPRFYAGAVSSGLGLHDRIEVTCLADPFRPVHLSLIVDLIDERDRLAVVKVLQQFTIERALPALPPPLPSHQAGADDQPRDGAGRFQRRPAA
jgi:hypothetical protein